MYIYIYTHMYIYIYIYVSVPESSGRALFAAMQTAVTAP